MELIAERNSKNIFIKIKEHKLDVSDTGNVC